MHMSYCGYYRKARMSCLNPNCAGVCPKHHASRCARRKKRLNIDDMMAAQDRGWNGTRDWQTLDGEPVNVFIPTAPDTVRLDTKDGPIEIGVQDFYYKGGFTAHPEPNITSKICIKDAAPLGATCYCARCKAVRKLPNAQSNSSADTEAKQ